ncbi:ankyrin repeat domain-containing protein SOWAHB isoform X2 [Bombus vosnesenskii]|uniref:Ankyrin repeat domain-containing protein SOWAHB isoform X2 n=4 Tax=Pyrobombus TaxID=144703 RepID=A0A6J3KIL8_9HYME|nr:ankyrin repeat domain-containing protein SOWAHB isoform X2 [Bombus impatiens]XP_033183589.1 ankyrin repeat domain-containing protein SOWAHB isoform X2 [Bombus vancouverensis nearcticus]XP_033297886.1 ankyrin repeat domain-containing protein SOWAHB isoform X2 [Bombus bifarius]XP_033352785.1 ankyrin repeat domain-containing protein SOWAHB isoform X2 [Bombus vosnesenskii]
MATPSELSIEEIREYLLENGGTARNHDLVKHFKKFLTDPETRVEARNRFKEYVNTLATIKNEEGERYLVLKKKYRLNSLQLTSPDQIGSPISTADISTPVSPLRVPPPYRSPPPAPLSPPANNTNAHREESCSNFSREEVAISAQKNGVDQVETGFSTSSPPVPPRRKSQDKIKIENKENVDKNKGGSEAVIKEDEAVATNPGSTEQLSFRERMQRFNRMASETDLQGRPNGTITPTKKRSDKGADEDDSASVASQLDGKSREWLVRAAQGDYQALAKLATEEPRLTRLKDPTSYTALHWAAKHGDENIVKLIAGTYKDYIKSVNETSNGGYTPLHIAMQFGHENIFNLLVQVYGANQEVRDYSGKKARQYLVSQEAAVSQDTFRKIKARKKHAEKDLGFLRIGSLNVRVKRTTEAFSQFLGVATSSSASSNHEKIHKSWGSADNVQLEQKMMPPPKYAPIKKRRSRRGQDFGSSRDHQAASQPSTPLLQGKASRSSQSMHRRPISTTAVSSAAPKTQQNNDSDSDTACGFDSAWRGSAQL